MMLVNSYARLRSFDELCSHHPTCSATLCKSWSFLQVGNGQTSTLQNDLSEWIFTTITNTIFIITTDPSTITLLTNTFTSSTSLITVDAPDIDIDVSLEIQQPDPITHFRNSFPQRLWRPQARVPDLESLHPGPPNPPRRAPSRTI